MLLVLRWIGHCKTLGTKAFLYSAFLVCREWALASMAFSEFQAWQIQTVANPEDRNRVGTSDPWPSWQTTLAANQGTEGMQRQGRSSQETGAALRQSPGSSTDTHNSIFSIPETTTQQMENVSILCFRRPRETRLKEALGPAHPNLVATPSLNHCYWNSSPNPPGGWDT